MNRKWKIITILVFQLVLIYWVLKPTYELKDIKLGAFPYTHLTEMIYRTPFDRQLIYIYGEYHQELYPQKDYVVQKHFSGFDAYSLVLAVCDTNQKVVLYYDEGIF